MSLVMDIVLHFHKVKYSSSINYKKWNFKHLQKVAAAAGSPKRQVETEAEMHKRFDAVQLKEDVKIPL